MSQQDFESASVPSVIQKKPQLNIYTVLLIISLIALLLGCLFLFLEIRSYGGFGAVKGRVSSVTLPLEQLRAMYWV